MTKKKTPITKNLKNGFIPVIILFIILIGVVGYFEYKNQNTNNINVSNTSSPITENEVLGFQITSCCSCPTKVPTSLIGTDGWVIYERSKDYSDVLPAICKAPNIGVCAPCPPLEDENDKSTTEEKFCGGIAGIICPNGYFCKYDGKYPDAGGKCVKK